MVCFRNARRRPGDDAAAPRDTQLYKRAASGFVQSSSAASMSGNSTLVKPKRLKSRTRMG